MSAPTPPAEIDALLVDAVTGRGGPDAHKRLDAALLAANVGWLLAPDGDGAPAPVTVPHPDGPLVAFFSGPDPLREAAEASPVPGLRTAVLPCRELWRMAVGNGAGTVLNPFNRFNKMFTTSAMADLLAGGRATVAAPTVTEATDVPTGLLTAIAQQLGTLPGPVERATLTWASYPDRPAGYLLVVVTDLAADVVGRGLDDVADTALDLLVQRPAGADGLTDGIAPFWPVAAR